jgi:putative ABC transport system permease protein
MSPKPSALAELLLRAALPADEAETISGDLEEMFLRICARDGRRAARRWHRRQVMSVVTAWMVHGSGAGVEAPRRRRMMDALRQDLGYAVRSLRKQPAFTVTVVLMLALGIGANVAIFSLINAVLLKPLPFPQADRLMLVHSLVPERDAPGVFRTGVWSYPKYQVFQQNQQVFDAAALFRQSSWNITGTGSPERVIGEFVEHTYFDVLGVGTQTGRTFSADETRPFGSPPLALLGHGFWQRRFGGDPAVLGRTISLNQIPHTIVGVLPAGFRGLTGESDIWVPLMTLPASDFSGAWSHSYWLVARLKPGATPEQARSAMTAVAGAIAGLYKDPFGSTPWGATAALLHDDRVDPLIRRSMLIMLAAVAAVLLIVCINLANLTLARSIGRQREVGIRLALGANRFRIVRQFMTESLLLSLLGTGVGLFVAYVLVSAGASMMPELRMVLTGSRSTQGLTRVGLGLLRFDTTVLLFAFAMAAITAVLFGLGPAVRSSRRDLTSAIKRGAGAVTPATRGIGIRNALAMSEMALALVLLTAGGLMVKSVARLQAAEIGFDRSSVLTVRVGMPLPKYDGKRATQLIEQLIARLDARPEVEAAAFGNVTPVAGGGNSTNATFPGRPELPLSERPLVGVFWASPTYFETLGIRLIRGRVFTDHDRTGQPKVVVINETAARKLWGGDPIGQRIGVGQGGFQDGAEVVGIVADVRYGAIESTINPDVYMPLLQSPRASGVIFVRGRASTASLVAAVRHEMRALDPDMPLVDIKTMEERLGDAMWRTRMSAWLLGSFAILGLLLAAVGVYGVMSQGVAQRMREIGVRIALGAGRGDIFRLIIGRVAIIAVAGVAVGIALAIPATRVLKAMLYQVEPGDPAVIGLLALVLLSVAVAAGYLPARRATRVDPLTTLRSE